MKQQKGFTLIELVIVIVILGILAAVAVPKFVDLEADARQAAVDGVAGGINSAFAINFAAVQVNKGQTLGGDAELCDLVTFTSILATPIDAEYSVDAASVGLDCSVVGTANGDSVATCILTDTDSNTANVTVICAK